MRKPAILTLFLFFHALFLVAQPVDLSKEVSVHFDRLPLKQALHDLERRYDLRFSYSSDHIPLSQRVSVHRERTRLDVVLEDLFAATKVVFAPIGRQIVLKIDPAKPVRDPWNEASGKMGYREPEILILPIGSREIAPIEWAPDPGRVKPVVLADPDQTVFPKWSFLSFVDSLHTGMPEGKRFYQVSIFPPFGTNGWESANLTNLYSVNMFAGLSAGVEGAEGSLLLNVTEGNVKGLQVSLLGNVAEGNLYGKQLSAGVNMVQGLARGKQIGLVNVAGEMSGMQIGLANVADSVSGLSLGLLNLVRKGYNRVELGYSESMHASVALKLGTYGFYNLFYSGFRWEENAEDRMFGLGYGLGTNIWLARRLDLNVEGLAIRMLRREFNLLSQARVTFDWRLAKRFSLFAGGTLNLLTSETADSPLELSPYTFFRHTTRGGKDLSAWAGFLAGVRF